MELQSGASIRRHIGAGLAGLMPWPRRAWPGGVVSFTFDDFPRSAWLTGAAILAAHDARGTYYAASGLFGTEGPQGPVATADDVRAAYRAGHEIGCHTLSHVNCAEASSLSLLGEVRSNAEAIQPLLDGRPMTSFAYPFGATAPHAKRVMQRQFFTARGIRPGINRRGLDRAELRANRIYDHDFDAARMRALVDENRAVGGWLIFYTHDVSEAPSPYGCTPDQLALVVAYAAARSEIQRVDDVTARIRAR